VDYLSEIPDGHSVGSDPESLLALKAYFNLVIVPLMALLRFLSVPVTCVSLGSVIVSFMGMVVTLTGLGGAVVLLMAFM